MLQWHSHANALSIRAQTAWHSDCRDVISRWTRISRSSQEDEVTVGDGLWSGIDQNRSIFQSIFRTRVAKSFSRRRSTNQTINGNPSLRIREKRGNWQHLWNQTAHSDNTMLQKPAPTVGMTMFSPRNAERSERRWELNHLHSLYIAGVVWG